VVDREVHVSLSVAIRRTLQQGGREIGGHQTKRFEIHGETQPVPNRLTGKVERVLVFDHVVVAGTEPDEAGDLHAVCGGVVDPLPWMRPLREWLKLSGMERCAVCDERVGAEIRRFIDLEGAGVWGWQ